MKALTICQPYAELIACGEKPIENRSWPTQYRGSLLIHAGKSREWMDEGDEDAYPGMAFGAFVAVAQLVACLELDIGVFEWPAPYRTLRCHEHANGPWCWILSGVGRLLVPVPWRGAQGLWDVPADALAAIDAASYQPLATTPRPDEGEGA